MGGGYCFGALTCIDWIGFNQGAHCTEFFLGFRKEFTREGTGINTVPKFFQLFGIRHFEFIILL